MADERTRNRGHYPDEEVRGGWIGENRRHPYGEGEDRPREFRRWEEEDFERRRAREPHGREHERPGRDVGTGGYGGAREGGSRAWRDREHEGGYARSDEPSFRQRGATAGYGKSWEDQGRDRQGGYGGQDQDRGFFDRASDEVQSWFGDDDAQRRRQRDAHEGDRGAQHHRGRGPQGYRRSDERIREDVNDRLTEDGYVDASNIQVRVENGEITLDGQVDSRAAKRRAEDIADGVSGVSHVQNNLRVQDNRNAGAAVQRNSGIGDERTGALGSASGSSGTNPAGSGTGRAS